MALCFVDLRNDACGTRGLRVGSSADWLDRVVPISLLAAA